MTSLICKANDKAHCRYHSKSAHAKMALEAAQAATEKTLKTFGSDPSRQNQNALSAAQHNQTKAEIVYASFDEGAPEFSALFKEATGARKAQLAKIITAAKLEREERGAREVIEAEEAKRFEEIKKEVASEKELTVTSPSWMHGYNKAISKILAKEGRIVYAQAVEMEDDPRSPYYYGGRKDALSTKHLRECGPLQVREIANQSYDEFMDSLADAEDTTNYCVRGKVTCNCGILVEQYVELEGNFSDLARRVSTD